MPSLYLLRPTRVLGLPGAPGARLAGSVRHEDWLEPNYSFDRDRDDEAVVEVVIAEGLSPLHDESLGTCSSLVSSFLEELLDGEGDSLFRDSSLILASEACF